MQMTSLPFWLMIVSIADGGFAGLAVADDQLTLAATDRRHGVDGLDAGLQRLMNRLTVDDAWRLDFDDAALGRLQRALAVDRLAKGVDDAAQQAFADRNRVDFLEALDGVAFLDALDFAEDGNADVVFFKVQDDAPDAVFELDQLAGHGAFKAINAGNPVTDRQHRAGFLQLDAFAVVLDSLADDLADFFYADLFRAH